MEKMKVWKKNRAKLPVDGGFKLAGGGAAKRSAFDVKVEWGSGSFEARRKFELFRNHRYYRQKQHLDSNV